MKGLRYVPVSTNYTGIFSLQGGGGGGFHPLLGECISNNKLGIARAILKCLLQDEMR